MPSLPLSPTDRSTIRRHTDRARADRDELFALFDDVLICHLGIIRDGYPLVIPTIFAADAHGPDDGGTLYIHGSVASRSIVDAPGAQLCVTVTSIDGLVLARSAFHHSMNYRSAVIIGTGRPVLDDAERRHALDLVVDHIVPGRSRTLRAHLRKELAATAVIAIGLREASLKQRSGDPIDDEADVTEGVWAGVIPLSLRADPPLTAADANRAAIPADVIHRVRSLGGVDPCQ